MACGCGNRGAKAQERREQREQLAASRQVARETAAASFQDRQAARENAIAGRRQMSD
jgi:hypothetical protein